jgi:hypothetical protein
MEEQELMNLDKLFALENGLIPEDYVKQKKAERDAQKPKEVPIILKVRLRASFEAKIDYQIDGVCNLVRRDVLKSFSFSFRRFYHDCLFAG